MRKKILLPALLLTVALSMGFAANALVGGTPTPLSTNTVTQISYPTATNTITTTVTETGTATSVIQPVEILTTTTVIGTQTYTITETATETTSVTTTATSTLPSDWYTPFYMYWTATSDSPFYRQPTTSPISLTTSDGTTMSESSTGFDGGSPYSGSVSMQIVSTSSTYRDLGFYYEFQNLNLGQLATDHSITVTGSGFAVNLWIQSQDWNWAPSTPPTETFVNLGSDGAYGFATGASTVGPSASIYLASNTGTCTAGSTHTVAELVSTCGLSGSDQFALWVGITSTSVGTTSAMVTQIASSPFP